VCNDDGDGLNPVVDIPSPAEGTYDIWVGSLSQRDVIEGYLMLTASDYLPTSLNTALLSSGGSTGTTTQPNQPVEEPASTLPEKPQNTPQDNPLSNSGAQPRTLEEIEGIQFFPNLSTTHVETPVEYEQNPPVGGNHNPVWQNCGVYDSPIFNELAVHSLEHGAVWITYDPSLPAADVATLAEITEGGTHRLLSPYPDLPAPVVVSAWGYQVQLEGADDPRLMQFITLWEADPQNPEIGATCGGAVDQTIEQLTQGR
jgi:hypothetical protein